MTTSTATQLLPIKPLTRDAFAPYGDVIECHYQATHYAINDGNTRRYHDLANVDVNTQDGRPLINIFRSTPLPLPIKLSMMERHPLSSQAFVPMGTEPYLVVVAPKGELNLHNIQVFLATAEQGVNYHAGTWHHYSLALNNISDFLVIDRGGKGDNCDIKTLDGSLIIDLTQIDF